MKMFAATEPCQRIAPEEAVWLDPERTSGVPCFRSTRLPVRQAFVWLDDGIPLDEFVSDFRVDPRAAVAVMGTDAAVLAAAPSDIPDFASTASRYRGMG